jgi:hypothetical protein
VLVVITAENLAMRNPYRAEVMGATAVSAPPPCPSGTVRHGRGCSSRDEGRPKKKKNPLARDIVRVRGVAEWHKAKMRLFQLGEKKLK